MAGIDLSQGKIMFPPRFVPYMEKHRIFELFHELTELLVQERPKDHVKFMRSVLPCAAKRRDKPRIVFFAPSSFDRAKFADKVAKLAKIPAITRAYLEMKERERRMLERLRRQEMVLKPIAEEEELSCICPGEYDLGEYEFPKQEFSPPYYQDDDDNDDDDDDDDDLQAESDILNTDETMENIESSTKEETFEQKVVPEEDPCKGMRVCPCKELELAREEMGPPGIVAAREGVLERNLSDDDYYGDTTISAESNKDRIPKDQSKSAATSESELSSTVVSSCICESSEETVVDYSVLGKCEYTENGWILVDFPEDRDEAEYLTSQGVLPTHAVRIITGSEDEKVRHYKYLSKNWEVAYRSVPVTEIHVNGRNLTELAATVAKLLRIMPHRHAPMMPRIVLIGSRGSGATTQAERLSRKYKMAHIEFQEEMAKVVLRDDALSQTYKRQLATRPDPELEAALLEKILLLPKCRRRGWVLTGYPTNIDQLRMLDIMATPPNRIIFLEVPAKECFIRLYYRKTDWSNATEYKLPVIEPFGLEARDPTGLDPEVAARLLPHPRDDRRQIIHDIEEYFQEKEEMMKYCGRTASLVNGDATVETVFELIDQIIINPAPAEPPRDPLAIHQGIDEAYERLKSIRMESGITTNNMMINPPDPILKF